MFRYRFHGFRFPGHRSHGPQWFPRQNYSTYRKFGNATPVGGNLLTNPRTVRFLGFFTVVSGVYYISHLEETPYSHRRRFIAVSSSLEKWIGDRGYRETLDQFKGHILPPNHPQTLHVKRVMDKIIAVSGLKDLDWRIHVVNDPKQPPNAFVLPGGKVFVFSSILPICKNDDGLATVLSHETAHQIARHTAENMSKAPLYLMLGLALYALTGSDYASQIAVSTLLKLPASREMEREADHIGLDIMARACFHPEEAVHVWERMTLAEQRGSMGGVAASIPEFLSTHPASKNRIQLMKSWMPEAQALRASSECDQMGLFRAWDF